jgi:ankyrin repeat protein
LFFFLEYKREQQKKFWYDKKNKQINIFLKRKKNMELEHDDQFQYIIMKNNINTIMCGSTYLIDAIKDKNLKLIEYLLENGAHINLNDENGISPFRQAILSSELDIIKLLSNNKYLPHGFSLQIDFSDFEIACKSRNFKIIEYLFSIINKNSLREYIDYVDLTNISSDEILMLLLKNGADPFKYSFIIRIIEYFPQRKEQLLKLMEMKKKLDPNILKKKIDIFFDCCSNGNSKVLEFILQIGFDVEREDCKGKTAIFYSLDGHPNNLKLLINKAKANINHKNKYGQSILFHKMNNETLTYLFDNGLNINLLDDFNRTVLNYFCSLEYSEHSNRYYIENIYLFISLRVNPKIKDNDGDDTLYNACSNNHLQIVEILLKSGTYSKEELIEIKDKLFIKTNINLNSKKIIFDWFYDYIYNDGFIYLNILNLRINNNSETAITRLFNNIKLIQYGYIKIKDENKSNLYGSYLEKFNNGVRFYKIISKLSFELQIKICYLIYDCKQKTLATKETIHYQTHEFLLYE